MNKIISFFLCLCFSLLVNIEAQSQKVVIPDKYQVDTRIDNMGYWRKMAAAGLVPVQPYSKPPAAKFTGSKIIAKGIMIDDSPDVPVTTEPSTQSENSIAVDPENMEMLLNSNNSTQYPSSGSLYGADYLTSSDEGETWGGSVQGAGGPNSGDPAACIDLDGRYFVGFIDNASGQSVAYSDNQGATWSVVKVATGSMFNLCDKNHLWVDNSPSSPYKGNLYNGWMKSEQIEISYSNTHGTSWSTPVAVSQGTSAGSHNQGVNFKTGPNGEAYAVWSVYDSWPGDEKAIGYSQSMDGGATWSPAVRIINNIRGIRTTEVTQNMRCNSFPSMAVDLSGGPYNGHIYVVWANIGVPGINTGSDVDVYLIKSTDGGTTWSTPLRVNQDPSGLGKQHYFPWIACDDSNGMLSIVFYDNRNVSATECEAFMAYSSDGGATWEDMKVSDVSFTPSPIPSLATGYFGDYLGITALGGKAYPCWTDNRSGHAMTYVSPIELIPPLNRDVIVYDEHGLNDATYGNGNGKMDFGETELLDLKLKNIGDIPGDSVQVTLSSASHYITFTDSTEYYGYFDVGTTKMIEDAFLFSVSDSMPHAQEVIFTVKAVDALDTVSYSNFSIYSHAPAVTIMSCTVFDPAPGGNGNNRLDPGETVTLHIQVTNTGEYNAEDVMCEIASSNPFVSIVNPVKPLGTLTPGQSATGQYQAIVDPHSYIGSAAVIHAYAHSTYHYDVRDFVLRIGLIVEDWETGDFNKFPWQFAGDADWTIDPVNKWEGNYAARSGDIGDNQHSDLFIGYNVMLDDSISFYRKTSAEVFYDKLKFYIDGLMVGQWSGNQNWKRVAYPVLAGPHVFRWEYMKDGQNTTGDDASWLDYIVFPPSYNTLVHAGNDDTICAGTTYQLTGRMINYDSLLWVTSGTGSFSNDTIANPLYYASPDDITNGNVQLTLHAYGMFASDSTDTMILHFVSPPETSAGMDGSVCASETFTVTTASASGYQSLLWSTSGDGTFDDPAIIHPTYTPGLQDITTGMASLFLTCYAQPPCQMTTDTLELTILESPVFWLGNDTTLCTGQFLVLDATTTGVSQYMWYPGLQTTPTVTIDSTGIGVGTQEFIAVLTNTLGCTGRDSIRITFVNCPGIEEAGITGFDIRPNPNNGNFTITFTTAKEKTIVIKVIDLVGNTVFKLPPQKVMGSYRKDLNLGGLRQGTYFLELTDEYGKINRKLIIQK